VRFGLDVNTEIFHNPKFDINNIYAMAQNFFTIESTSDILNTTMGVTSSLISGVSNLVLGLIIAIYILAEKDSIGKFTSRFFSAALPEKVYSKAKEICSVASNSFASFITGQFTDALLLGTMCFIGMLILGFPNAAVVSIIIGITALVPIIGPIVGEVIGCLIIFMESPIKALFFIIFVLILQMIDNNLIYPRIMGKSVGLPGVLVFIAVVIGGNIGGILGVLLGVPTASAIYALIINWLKNKKQRERELVSAKDTEEITVEVKQEENS
jgi:predicted PurR-regulated permease PerM